MGRSMDRIAFFLHHRYTYLAIGLLLVFCGVFEVIQDFGHTLFGLRIGAHHGMIILGLFQAANSLVAILQGHQSIFSKEG
ncbi:MAG: hypothetical protein JW821_10095 [Deltaproteobacteria bacterium]|nr:hypothetical protein [Deltaproteobacteria bacterium]